MAIQLNCDLYFLRNHFYWIDIEDHMFQIELQVYFSFHK